jgi:hypothetical protein
VQTFLALEPGDLASDRRGMPRPARIGKAESRSR